MKKIFGLMLFILVSIFAVSVFAQVPGPVVPPDWLNFVLGLISKIPYVGGVIAFIVKWTGLVAGIMTALSVMVQAILGLPEIVARWSGATAIADKVKSISDAVLPWLKWLSIFNVPVAAPQAKKPVEHK